jgi:hypothetical protein
MRCADPVCKFGGTVMGKVGIASSSGDHIALIGDKV